MICSRGDAVQTSLGKGVVQDVRNNGRLLVDLRGRAVEVAAASAFTNVSFYSNFGEIRYRGLVVDLRKRMTGRLSYGANYVLAQSRDNAFNFVRASTATA